MATSEPRYVEQFKELDLDEEEDEEDFEDDNLEDDSDLDDLDDDSDVDDVNVNGNLENKEEYVGARPRRLSELNIKVKTAPMPKYSSFFVFSHTNP